jgi:hypothetical protein
MHTRTRPTTKIKEQCHYWNGTRSVPCDPEPLWSRIFGFILLCIVCASIMLGLIWN